MDRETQERKIEDLKEKVMELVTNSQDFKDLVMAEYEARFPVGVLTETLDETICMCQLLVGQRILREVF